jgi:DNA-binding NtrC family response regulator
VADILVVDDDESIATAFQHFLTYEGHSFRIASNAEDATMLMTERQPNVVIMDVRMPGVDGLQALEEIRSRFPDVYVVIMTAYGTSQTSITAIRQGAFDYVSKPLDLDRLRSVIDKALEAQTIRDNANATIVLDGVSKGVALVGETAAMHEVYKMIGRLAANDVPALIVGERGTGKRLVVKTIHDNSTRREQAFLSLDCASIPEAALETALFGQDSGTVHVGAVEALTPLLQGRLAHALTDQRSSGIDRRSLAARVLATTEKDLLEEVRSGTFNRELYDVLAVITVRLPTLRERRDDIPLLVRHFIERFNDELSRTIKGVDGEVLRRLQEYSWPGNVGELERVIKRACIVARSDVVTADEIGQSLDVARFNRQGVESALSRTVRTALHERLVDRSESPSSAFHDIVSLVESSLVHEALTITNGNQVKAADILGVNRATLRKKIPDES